MLTEPGIGINCTGIYMYEGCWGFFYIDMTHFVGGAPHHVRDLPPPVGGAAGELVGCLG